MQFKLSLATLLALVATATAIPAPEVADILTHDEMINWLKTTNAKLTFVGEPIPGVNAPAGLVSREALTTTVTYCSERIDSVCGGACTVYTGGATCLNAPDTNCLSATNNVAFCSSPECGGSCNQLSTCGTNLDNGFCYTPDTESILVGSY